MSKVYLVASGKGGTGKTMFAVNLGSSYAQKGYKVVIVDMDMGLRNLDLYLGLENNGSNKQGTSSAGWNPA